MSAAYAFILAATLTVAPAEGPAADQLVLQAPVSPLAAAVAAAPVPDVAPERWMLDRAATRPRAIPVLYASLGALQALDIYSTNRALAKGGREVNPIVERAAGNTAAMTAVKAISTAGTIYFAERVWKKNRKGAVILMAVVNGITAGVVARNLRNAR